MHARKDHQATDDISIEFEIRPKFAVLSINTY